MPRSRGKWEYRDHWIANNIPNSDSYYAYWYPDAGTRRKGKTRRRSLKTADIEQAKDALVALVLSKETGRSDALVISILNRYIDEIASRLPSRDQARRALELFGEVLDGPERVSDLTEAFQIERILMEWRRRHGHSASYMSRNMSVLNAALQHCRTDRPPRILYSPRLIARLLRLPPPKAGRWFPGDDDLARFIDGLGSEWALRWTIIALNTACRPQAGIDLTPAQIDFRHRLINLNPPGRWPSVTKRRPILKLTECLAGWLASWEVGQMDFKSPAEYTALEKTYPWLVMPRYVPFRCVGSLKSAYRRTRESASVSLPQMVPYSIRNKMVTVFRIRQVPGIQRSQWLGHADPEEKRTTWCSYGEFDPQYLAEAAEVTDEYMWELNKLTDRRMFACVGGGAGALGEAPDPRVAEQPHVALTDPQIRDREGPAA